MFVPPTFQSQLFPSKYVSLKTSAAEKVEPTAFSSETTAETTLPHLEVEVLELVQIEVLETKRVDEEKGCNKGLLLLG